MRQTKQKIRFEKQLKHDTTKQNAKNEQIISKLATIGCINFVVCAYMQAFL